jgi:hypothetical protein
MDLTVVHLYILHVFDHIIHCTFYQVGNLTFCNSAFVVQRSGWTKDVDVFLSWLSGISFTGGGLSEAATCEGLSEALMVLTC